MTDENRSDRIRVVVVDDHPVVRQGVAALVRARANLHVVGEAGTVDDAVSTCLALLPDVVLLDLRLGSGSGVTVIQKVIAAVPRTKFIVFTTYDDDDDVAHAVFAGAVGYILKDAFGEEITQVIERVASGERVIPAAVEERVALQAKPVTLSERERDVLHLVAHGLSNREIAEALRIGEASVKTYVMRICTKLEVLDRTEAATAALRRGLLRR